jgi:hypothetical protein
MDEGHETEEQQKEIRKRLNETMKINAQAQTNFDNAWRKKLEKTINRK